MLTEILDERGFSLDSLYVKAAVVKCRTCARTPVERVLLVRLQANHFAQVDYKLGKFWVLLKVGKAFGINFSSTQISSEAFNLNPETPWRSAA